MTGVLSRGVTPKDNTKSNPIVRQNVRILSKSAVTFKSFAISLREDSFHSQMTTSIKEWNKMNKVTNEQAEMISSTYKFDDDA